MLKSVRTCLDRPGADPIGSSVTIVAEDCVHGVPPTHAHPEFEVGQVLFRQLGGPGPWGIPACDSPMWGTLSTLCHTLPLGQEVLRANASLPHPRKS